MILRNEKGRQTHTLNSGTPLIDRRCVPERERQKGERREKAAQVLSDTFDQREQANAANEDDMRQQKSYNSNFRTLLLLLL